MATLTEAVQTNDRRATLVALRDSIAATIDGTESGRDIAALSKRLMEVLQELDALPDPNQPANAVAKARAKAAARGSS